MPSNFGTTKRIQYMTPYKQGDIVLVAFPFTNLAQTKKRPACVISGNSYNKELSDCILMAITSNIPHTLRPDEYHLTPQDLQQANLPKPSIAKIGKLFTIEQKLIIKKLGNLPHQTITKLIVNLNTAVLDHRKPPNE